MLLLFIIFSFIIYLIKLTIIINLFNKDILYLENFFIFKLILFKIVFKRIIEIKILFIYKYIVDIIIFLLYLSTKKN